MGRPLETLSAEQDAALAKVSGLVGDAYFLVGGVAVAARFHHRVSHDLDVFTCSADPDDLADALAQAEGVRITGRAKSTVHMEVDGIPTSLIRYAYPLLSESENLPGIPMPVASVRDLVAMKLSAVANRGAARDFWDLHTMLLGRSISMQDALALFGRKFASHDVGHVVRALCYFDDANAAPLPRGLDGGHWQVICNDFRRWVLALQ